VSGAGAGVGSRGMYGERVTGVAEAGERAMNGKDPIR
jgi:hypothetical protein